MGKHINRETKKKRIKRKRWQYCYRFLFFIRSHLFHALVPPSHTHTSFTHSYFLHALTHPSHTRTSFKHSHLFYTPHLFTHSHIFHTLTPKFIHSSHNLDTPSKKTRVQAKEIKKSVDSSLMPKSTLSYRKTFPTIRRQETSFIFQITPY